MNRRDAISGLFAAATMMPWRSARAQPESPGNAWEAAGVLRIGATWREAGDDNTSWAGVLGIDAQAREVRIEWARRLPSRAHGLLFEADGSLLVSAVRPGRWMRRFDPAGEETTRLTIPEAQSRHLDGHAVASRDGQWLFTTETDARDDSGWVAVRSRHTLEPEAYWSTAGIEPHQLLLDDAGRLVVANGGIRRTANDDKRELDRMESSLVHIDTEGGELLGKWRLPDRRLSLRHLAWSRSQSTGSQLLGVGLQAEHDDADRRREAPALAVWDGTRLVTPSFSSDAAGYAGDIASAEQGFVLSSNRMNAAVWWNTAAPGRLAVVARLQEAYALAACGAPGLEGGVLVAAARGVGLWHPKLPAMMLAWPRPMALDNHWAAAPTTG